MDEILELTKRLIAFNTTTGHNKEARLLLEFLAGYLKEAGWKVRHYESEGYPSIVVSPSLEKRFKYCMLGHIDVVPAPEGMFQPMIEGDKIMGRGTMDMKSQVATMCVLLKRLAANKPSLMLMLTSDEEVGGKNGAGFLINEQGFECDFFVVPDGGNDFKLVTREKGILQLEVRVKGKTAHGSRPWQGVNAIELLMDRLQQIKGLFEKDNVDKWVTTLNIAKINGGEANNQVPGEAKAVLDIRFTEKPEELLEKIKAIVEVTVVKQRSVLDTDDDNEEVQRLAGIISEVTGKHIEPTFEHGASDAMFFAKKGIPGAIFNPAGGGSHSLEEHVIISSLGTFFKILERFFKCTKQ